MSQQDKGWAWVITTAVMLQNFLVVGLLKSFGLLFVEIMETFNASASMTSAVLGLQAAAFCIAAPVCLHYFSIKFSCRSLMFFGALTSSAGVAMTFLATDMIYLLFSCGVMIGIGNAFMHGPSLVVIGQYFKKRLSIANSIAIGGGSFGQLAFPPLVYILFDHYSLRGTLLLIGGLMLNCCVSASLMRPFATPSPICGKKHRTQTDTPSESQVVQEEVYQLLQKKATEKSTDISDLKDEGVFKETTSAENSDSVVSEDKKHKLQLRSCSNRHCLPPALIDVSLCRNPVFILLEIACALGNAGSTLHTIYLIPHARDLGLNEKMTSLLVIIIGGADILGKFICGYLGDLGWVKRYKLLASSMIISGTMAQFLVLFTTHESMMVYCAIVGTIGGFYYSLVSPLLMDFLGVNNLPRSLGITLCCEGIANTITPVLLGYLRDSTDNYFASFHLIGMFLLIAAMSLLSTKVVKKMCLPYLSRLE